MSILRRANQIFNVDATSSDVFMNTSTQDRHKWSGGFFGGGEKIETEGNGADSSSIASGLYRLFS